MERDRKSVTLAADGPKLGERIGLGLLILSYVIVCCLSSVLVTQFFRTYHVSYNSAELINAAIAVAIFAPVFLLFVFAEFSFGYFVGFYFCGMILGYLWLSFFSENSYDHQAARLSAAVAAIAFLLPALFLSPSNKLKGILSAKAFDRLLTAILLLSLVTAAIGASFNFRPVSPGDASMLRATDPFPAPLGYLIGIVSSSLLPFLFACSLARNQYWRAGATLVVLLSFYPITMTKTVFFAPAWLILVGILSRNFGARKAVILSLLTPAIPGVLLLFLANPNGGSFDAAMSYFYNVNFRMIAIPSLAMDVYNDFFSTHELTHFCQIRVLKSVIACPYQDQLSVVIQNYFPAGGTFNASLFATEGIASVGLMFAPLSAFACGLVIALGNRASSGLPSSLVVVSSAVLTQLLMNVPLSTGLLTHGGAFLLLLWYVMPREIFEQKIHCFRGANTTSGDTP